MKGVENKFLCVNLCALRGFASMIWYLCIVMKSHLRFLTLAAVCFTFSCGQNSNDSAENADDSSVIELNKEVVSAENVFIYIPSPIQTAELLKQAGAKYNADLLNDPDNASRYTTTASMALNMGVYGSDL